VGAAGSAAAQCRALARGRPRGGPDGLHHNGARASTKAHVFRVRARGRPQPSLRAVDDQRVATGPRPRPRRTGGPASVRPSAQSTVTTGATRSSENTLRRSRALQRAGDVVVDGGCELLGQALPRGGAHEVLGHQHPAPHQALGHAPGQRGLPVAPGAKTTTSCPLRMSADSSAISSARSVKASSSASAPKRNGLAGAALLGREQLCHKE
jgi:hypothetical protein